jgi:hypothetical protein
MPGFIPKIATDYIKNKKLAPAFSYKDVWHEEHATGFTVAKAMQLDVLADLHNATIAAIEKGESFDTFKKNLKPLLQQKGWWGKKKMTDPLTGKEVNAQLGSDRRLKTIYRVNMRSAYQKEQYEQTMQSDLHPYLMYRIGPSVSHRQDHVSWDGLVLPKTDPWWDAHLPPNGWGCRCYTRAVTEARFQKYKQQGVKVPPAADGTGGGTVQIKTQAPAVKYTTYFNERKGTFEKAPEGVDPAFNWNVGKASANKAAKQKLAETQKNYEAAVAAKPKKDYLTKKKLESDIAAIEAQIKGGGDTAVLKAKKAEAQKLLDAKTAAGEKKKLTKELAALQKEFDSLQIKTYSGIWKGEITTADWASKAGSLQAKKDWYKNQLAAPGIAAADKAKYEGFLKAIDEFDAEGKHYHTVLSQIYQTKDRLTDLKKYGSITSKADDAFSQARKNAALWAKSPKEADDALREVCGKVWRESTPAERKAAFAYTSGSGGFNRPLRGYDGSWGTFKGIGKVDLNSEGRADAIKELTGIINKSKYDIDIWLQRGVQPSGAARFLGIAASDLRDLTQSELAKRLDNTKVTDEAFLSCGSAKGRGFSGCIFNIYCPKGTKMLYAEPFSDYGRGGGLTWDGKKKQSDFGGEFETIIQRGTTFRITKVEKKGGNTFFDIEVVEQIGDEK